MAAAEGASGGPGGKYTAAQTTGITARIMLYQNTLGILSAVRHSQIGFRNPTVAPRPLAVAAMAVQVVRSDSGNHTTANRVGAPMSIGPAAAMRIWPMWYRAKAPRLVLKLLSQPASHMTIGMQRITLPMKTSRIPLQMARRRPSWLPMSRVCTGNSITPTIGPQFRRRSSVGLSMRPPK
eukprot:1565757-Rhodomonas_salina.2